jgi:hypothetical protein
MAVATWPLSLSFGDEVGYIGQTRLMIQGRVHPTPMDPGIWYERHDVPGLIPKYPLFFSLLMVPFLALSPSLVFVPGLLAGIALAWIASRALESWGHSRLWGLIVLMDPTVVLLSRTVMADVGLAFLGLGTWYFVRRGAVWQTVLFAALTMAIKTYGVVTVGAILAGQSLVLLREGRRPLPVLRLMAPLMIGMAIGAGITVALNLMSHGTVHSSYNVSASQAFGLRFLNTSGRAYWKSLVLCPPLLIAGVVPFWRRRDFGALFAIGASIAMFSIYFFVDWGVGFLDSVVLSRRLILPVVAFLLVGYAELLAQFFGRLPLARVARVAVVVMPALLALGLGLKHRQWQEPSYRALNRAEAWTQKIGDQELGITPSAFKIGLLYPGRTVFVTGEGDRATPNLVLCHGDAGSYRMGGVRYSCEIPGYRVAEAMIDDGYYILERGTKAN